MEAWLDAHPEWASDWTKCSAVRNVQVAFNWAVKKKMSREQLVRDNPFKGVTRRPGRPAAGHNARRVSGSVAGRFPPASRAALAGRTLPANLDLPVATGCRPKEAATMRWTDVNFGTGAIVLKEHKTIRTQANPRPRVIPMDPVVVKLLLFD